MEKYYQEILYASIWRVREMCAGSRIQPLETVIKKTENTLDYARTHNAPEVIIGKLNKVLNLLRTAKHYKDRLEPDQILCAILNKDLIEVEQNKGVTQ